MHQLPARGQEMDLFAIHPELNGDVSHLLFTGDGSGFSKSEAFLGKGADLTEWHPHLTVSGDFTGDGRDEIALFEDLLYEPNMNPDFLCSVVSVYRSSGEQIIPSGSWFSVQHTQLNFEYVSFAVADDYNMDGLCDILLFYNDPSSDQLIIYLLASTGSEFSSAQEWYTVDRNEFNFTRLEFACPGHFNANSKPDVAVFYNYNGTAPETRQAIFIFESDGDTLSLLPVAYDATKASYDFSRMKHAIPGDYNLDGYSDIAVLYEDPAGQNHPIPVFEASAAGLFFPVAYLATSKFGPDPAHVLHAAGGQFAGDTAADLALFYDNPNSGRQEILLLESESGSFNLPVKTYSADPGTLSMADLSAVRSGKFSFQAVVSVATWKDDRQGAISFTFDDGYRGAFEHGGAELESADLKGTFYIFTDTSAVYDGELASTTLVREYKNKGHEIASHTSNHSNLGFLTESGDVDSLEQVLSASVEVLNQRFGQYTMSMSIPFGSFRYETLKYISSHFYSARSSQHGFNLATPYDLYALKSWPILSTTSPAYVDNLLSIAESYGTYLPLMYHDMLDEPFDEDLHIYTYSRDHFRETVQAALSRDLWIDTHERIYKYIRERNALKILSLDDDEMDQQAGNFSFIADDGLEDSIFNVELTLRITLPQNWTEDTVSVGPVDDYSYLSVKQDERGRFIYYDWLPVSNKSIQVLDGKPSTVGFSDHSKSETKVALLAAPNPFRQETIIRVSGNIHEDTYLIVRDIHGRIVQELREQTGDSYGLSGASLAPGIYVAQLVQSGKTIASLKLMAL
jgi:peptidoglycan/xylan/chitin deacetylase (PgdA/CDA1 family)